MCQLHTDEFLRAPKRGPVVPRHHPATQSKGVANGAVLLDVRERDEYEAGYIEGGRRCSRRQLEDAISTLAPDRHTPIVCYCGGGNRGAPK